MASQAATSRRGSVQTEIDLKTPRPSKRSFREIVSDMVVNAPPARPRALQLQRTFMYASEALVGPNRWGIEDDDEKKKSGAEPLEVWYWKGDDFTKETLYQNPAHEASTVRIILPLNVFEFTSKGHCEAVHNIERLQFQLSEANDLLSSTRICYFKELNHLRTMLHMARKEKTAKSGGVGAKQAAREDAYGQYIQETDVQFFDIESTLDEDLKEVFTTALKDLQGKLLRENCDLKQQVELVGDLSDKQNLGKTFEMLLTTMDYSEEDLVKQLIATCGDDPQLKQNLFASFESQIEKEGLNKKKDTSEEDNKIKELQGQIEVLTSEIQNIKMDNREEMDAREKANLQERDNMRGQLKKATTAAADMETKLKIADEKVAALEEELKIAASGKGDPKMKAENELLKGKVTDFEKQLAEFETLTERLENTQGELNDCKEKILELSQDLANERQLVAQQAEKAALADSLEMEMARKVKEAIADASEELSAENQLLKERVAQLETQLEEKMAELSERETTMMSLKNDLQQIGVRKFLLIRKFQMFTD